MEEIEPAYFKPFPYSVIPKNAPKEVLEKQVLKKIYKHMLNQMQVWFQDKADEMKETNIQFQANTINLQRLYSEQDMNEVLVLAEYIMVIVVQGENSIKLLERLFDLS